ncbi:uncharacterized protein LOC122649347 [Telopea speciosissima]|uniref:uncharacterized protein LOC122649347 n=1 Tax=Telopea speciosissima TaxID=54955 RepID=UPI001CC443C5|nr:uncharacterized protein LOC122649347 [Telopea speciosissima]
MIGDAALNVGERARHQEGFKQWVSHGITHEELGLDWIGVVALDFVVAESESGGALSGRPDHTVVARLETYLKSLGYGVWMFVKNGYKIPTGDRTDTVELKKYENNFKAKNVLLSALVNTEFAKVVGCETAKEVWDKLQNVHEGDEKIKEAKLQYYRSLFDNLKMSNEDIVESFMSKVNEIINAIRSLGEKIKDAMVVKKILRSLPDLYNPKVSAIEESKNLNELSLDELHGILTTYEMRMVKPKSTEKEVAFKAMKKLKIKQENDNEDSDDELIAYLARKFKNGKASNDHQEEEEKSNEDEESEAEDLKTIFYTTLNEFKIERKRSKMLERKSVN